jgi:homoserine O-acetyltransferase
MRISGHNRMWRKVAIEGIKADPAWQGGNYSSQPALGLRTAVSLLQVAGFAPLYLQKAYPTPDAADAYIIDRIAKDMPTRDANDLIYQLSASYDYDPSAALERIEVPMTWVNSSDDFINPWDYGIAEKAAARLPNARYLLIKATDETRGHGTHTWAKYWKSELVDLLKRTETR